MGQSATTFVFREPKMLRVVSFIAALLVGTPAYADSDCYTIDQHAVVMEKYMTKLKVEGAGFKWKSTSHGYVLYVLLKVDTSSVATFLSDDDGCILSIFNRIGHVLPINQKIIDNIKSSQLVFEVKPSEEKL